MPDANTATQKRPRIVVRQVENQPAYGLTPEPPVIARAYYPQGQKRLGVGCFPEPLDYIGLPPDYGEEEPTDEAREAAEKLVEMDAVERVEVHGDHFVVYLQICWDWEDVQNDIVALLATEFNLTDYEVMTYEEWVRRNNKSADQARNFVDMVLGRQPNTGGMGAPGFSSLFGDPLGGMHRHPAGVIALDLSGIMREASEEADTIGNRRRR